MVKRSQLEHALRAAKEVTGENEFIVVGSASILGSFPVKGEAITLATREIDIYPRFHPKKSIQLEAIGRDSPFSVTHGFWIDSVGPETATLPKGWEERLVKVCNENTNGAIGWRLDPHDVAVSKLVAHRPKDIEFVEAILKSGAGDANIIRKRLAETEIPHRQILNMAESHLDQILDDIKAARVGKAKPHDLKKLMDDMGISMPEKKPSRGRGRDFEPGP